MSSVKNRFKKFKTASVDKPRRSNARFIGDVFAGAFGILFLYLFTMFWIVQIVPSLVELVLKLIPVQGDVSIEVLITWIFAPVSAMVLVAVALLIAIVYLLGRSLFRFIRRPIKGIDEMKSIEESKDSTKVVEVTETITEEEK